MVGCRPRCHCWRRSILISSTSASRRKDVPAGGSSRTRLGRRVSSHAWLNSVSQDCSSWLSASERMVNLGLAALMVVLEKEAVPALTSYTQEYRFYGGSDWHTRLLCRP